MGKTGKLGPPPGSDSYSEVQPVTARRTTDRAVTIGGADLYRLNCRGCHGEAGLGAPPEINSVINPVRATSPRLTRERMKTVGMQMSASEVAKLASDAEAGLLTRLHSGGQNMPAFPQLNQHEVRVLVAYLKQLAAVPGAQKEQRQLRETQIRVGELIVKGTCHTCHDATGLNPDGEQLLRGAIPPLSALTARAGESGLVRKVTRGAPVFMGPLATPSRGRMPVFDYLTDEEASDVFRYLTEYPPQPAVDENPPDVQRAGTVVAARLDSGGAYPGAPQGGGTATIPGLTLLFAAIVVVVIAMIAGGLAFTFREISRLGAEGEARMSSLLQGEVEARDGDSVISVCS